MSVMEWPGWLKCDGTAAVALAWSGLFWIVTGNRNIGLK